MVGPVGKNILSPESQTDFFQCPKKKSVTVPTKQSCLETTSLSPVATCSNKSLDLEQLVSDVREHEMASNETCSKYVRVSNLFNDSSLLFQSNTNSFNKIKNEDINTKPIVVKDLSKNFGSNNDQEREIETSLEDIVTIPSRIVSNCISGGPNVEESAEQSAPETIKQCPICLKTVSKYVSHMKSCASKNKLNTQQLLSALNLHKKQLAERKELGLDVPPVQSYRARVSPKRSRAIDKKVG